MNGRLLGIPFALLAAVVAASCASSPLEAPPGVGGSLIDGEGGASGEAQASGGEAGDECIPGVERCDCRPDMSCDEGLICLSNRCVDGRGLCSLSGNRYCDEPNPCPVGTDADCCATVQDGVCEETREGGACPDGTDWHDCGYCPSEWQDDGFCDEPSTCPLDSDPIDCCAENHDGVCDETSMGGECADGTDSFDCGYCPEEWIGDGFCDEPDFCAAGTDEQDCCVIQGNGVCDESGMGGECMHGSDWYDCGYCPEEWLGDGFCDEIQQGGYCPSNTDPEDCCATWGDEVCEEPSDGGECPTGSDYFDCGYCVAQWVNDGFCDEVGQSGPCPVDSDGEDCCATWRDGTCEEESMGGACPDGSDWYDCDYCRESWLEDAFCHETPALWACPEGSDSADCEP